MKTNGALFAIKKGVSSSGSCSGSDGSGGGGG